MSLPTISIVIPCYNASNTIARTIHSLVTQDFINLQIIVIDGNSTDGTQEVVQDFKDSIDIFISEPDRGQTHAINKGINYAEGELINWLCADDELAPDALNTIAESKQNNPEANLFLGSCLRIFPDQSEFITEPSENVFQRISYHNGIDQPACFWSKELQDKCGALDESYHHAMDWDWWNRLALADPKVIRIDKVLAKYYFPEDSKTSTGGRKQMEEMYKVIKKYGPLDGYLADIYKYLYVNFDLKGCYDKSAIVNPVTMLKRNRTLQTLVDIFGKEYIYSYNWNFCSKQERGLCWYK